MKRLRGVPPGTYKNRVSFDIRFIGVLLFDRGRVCVVSMRKVRFITKIVEKTSVNNVFRDKRIPRVRSADPRGTYDVKLFAKIHSRACMKHKGRGGGII